MQRHLSTIWIGPMPKRRQSGGKQTKALVVIFAGNSTSVPEKSRFFWFQKRFPAELITVTQQAVKYP